MAKKKVYSDGMIALKYFAPVAAQRAAFRLMDGKTMEGMEENFQK